MKITALEIRQKEFQKGFRGFDKDEVEAFLLSLSQEWERMVEENKEYKIKLDNAQKEVSKLREVEDSLFKTLKTAETTGANVVEQANKTAELIVQESRMKAEQTLDDAQRKSDRVYTSMLTEFSELEREFRTLENVRENLLSEIRNLSNDSLDKIERIDTSRRDFTEIKNLANKIALDKADLTTIEAPKGIPLVVEEEVIDEVKKPEVVQKEVELKVDLPDDSIKFEVPKENIIEPQSPDKKDDDKSFFDQIGE